MRKKLQELETLLKHAILTTSPKELTPNLFDEIEQVKQFCIEKAFSANTAGTSIQIDALQAQHTLSRIYAMMTTYLDRNIAKNLTFLPDDIPIQLSEVIHGLEDLETILEQYFSQYLDQKLRIPLILLNKFTVTIRHNIPFLKKTLLSRKLDQNFIAAILQPFEAIASPTAGEKISTGKLLVTREMLEGLTELLNPANITPDPEIQLINIAVYCNLNTLSVASASISILQERYVKDEYPLEKLFAINSQISHFSEIAVKSYLNYEYTNRHLKVAILEWLHAQLQIQENELKEWQAIPINPRYIKILTKLGVSDIGLLIKLFFEADAILNDNRKEVVRLFARSTRTITKKKDEPISEYKLWNATYKPAYHTLIKGRIMLKNMLFSIDKEIKEKHLQKK